MARIEGSDMSDESGCAPVRDWYSGGSGMFDLVRPKSRLSVVHGTRDNADHSDVGFVHVSDRTRKTGTGGQTSE